MSPWLLPLLATVAGVVSFTSPCCLPLVPGYLSYVSALPVADLGRREARVVALRASATFVLGFTVVFTAVGVAVGLLGSTVTRNLPTMVRIAGAFVPLSDAIRKPPRDLAAIRHSSSWYDPSHARQKNRTSRS